DGNTSRELGHSKMAFYWSARSLPELRQFSAAERERIVQEALRTLPVSFWSGLLVISFMATVSTIGIMVAIALGKIAVFILELPLLLLVKAMLLNLARPWIRQLTTENNPDEP